MKNWSVRVYCPHGVCHQMPLSWIYRMNTDFQDLCPNAEPPEESVDSPGRFKMWRETRRLRKAMRNL